MCTNHNDGGLECFFIILITNITLHRQCRESSERSMKLFQFPFVVEAPKKKKIKWKGCNKIDKDVIGKCS